jgi:hypothetical protein
MSRDKEERVEKNEAYPLRYVEFFSTLSDAVAGHISLAAVGIGFVRSSKSHYKELLNVASLAKSLKQPHERFDIVL